MKKIIFGLLAIALGCLATQTHANDEKCSALAKLAATVYKNKADANEFQLLQKWESSSHPIDFAFIRLFTGFSFNVNRLPASDFQAATENFCQKIVSAAISPESGPDDSVSPQCQPLIAHSQIINTFKRSGDTPATLRKQFLRTYSQSKPIDRGIVDYLSLMSELRFSNLFASRTDEDFMRFSKKSCATFTGYIAKIENSR